MKVIMPPRGALMRTVLGWVVAGTMSASQTGANSVPSQQAKPAIFEVVAIKPSDPSVRGDCYLKGQPGGQTFVGRCFPLGQLIKYA